MMKELQQPWVVYCDFDGTVTSTDCVDFLLNRLADPEWRVLEAMWENNQITSRDCMKAQIPLIRGGWNAIQNCLEEVNVTPGFVPFSQWCRNQQIPIFLVSEGLDRVIHSILDRIDVKVDGIFSNRLETDEDRPLALSFPCPPKDKSCGLGLCKCQILEQTLNLITPPGSENTFRIVIGDGASDYCWSAEADLLFAKKKLKTYCEQEQIPFVPFQDFNDIQNHLQELMRRKLRTIAVPA